MINDSDKNLILFTRAYPYTASGSEPFLDPEVDHLVGKFRKVTIIPFVMEGPSSPLNPRIYIEKGLAKDIKRAKQLCFALGFFYLFVLIFCYPRFIYQEFKLKPMILLNPSLFLIFLEYSSKALIVKNWVIKYIKKDIIDLPNTVFYTYWFNAITTGLTLAKENFPNMTIVSRIHGGDLYEKTMYASYAPFRRHTLAKIDRLFFVSKNGKDYLQERFPQFSEKYQLARLGVHNPGFTCPCSRDGTFRIVSCSFLIKLKRIDLLIEGIAKLAGMESLQKILWHHIGCGPLKDRLNKYAQQKFPENVRYTFLGQISNQEIFEFYKNNPVDVFVNVSSSEGIPISIMEAQSCGIPAVATNVGGVAEIVTETTGILLSSNPPAEEIANALNTIRTNPELTQTLRQLSIKNWEKNFNAQVNHSEFAKNLAATMIKTHL